MAVINGTSGNNSLVGGTGQDTINGLAGNEMPPFGGNGNDRLFGGNDDFQTAAMGNDCSTVAMATICCSAATAVTPYS